jgi:hypothetical protein
MRLHGRRHRFAPAVAGTHGPGPVQAGDDAEAYAAELIAEHGEPEPADDPVLRYLGGEFTLPDAQVPQA